MGGADGAGARGWRRRPGQGAGRAPAGEAPRLAATGLLAPGPHHTHQGGGTADPPGSVMGPPAPTPRIDVANVITGDVLIGVVMSVTSHEINFFDAALILILPFY